MVVMIEIKMTLNLHMNPMVLAMIIVQMKKLSHGEL